ncbi:uncharacterized protein LOC129187765 isoform X1 [Dunckerocampus dactyliophorus]|uniref:uncharacterized protein LOC129187765 isoform X1 n=1 Tax=Dunckerocampus dactyliophorus TaxID=161453 RepID=UPI002406B298|nr:uncharacterized protein LOC129187765 isoform X1 [Dunckerocampus dactyliophorus]
MCFAYMVFPSGSILIREPILKAISYQNFSISQGWQSHIQQNITPWETDKQRFNRTLGSMIRCLPLAAKQHWVQQIQTLTFAYNATVHETTGYAPFYLMFGRVPRLPVDMVFKQVLKDANVVDSRSYASKLMTNLHEAAAIAQRHARKEQLHQADGYNKRVRGTCLHVGDRVLLANKAERGKKKLADKWEPTIYTIIDCNPQTHIYRIEDVTGKTKVVHRKLILDVSFLPFPNQTSAEAESVASDGNGGSPYRPPSTLNGLAEKNSVDRTRSWLRLSFNADSESLEQEMESEQENDMSCFPIRDAGHMMCEDSQTDSVVDGSMGQSEKVSSLKDSPSPSGFSESQVVIDYKGPLTGVPNMRETGSCDILAATVNGGLPPAQDSGPEGRVVRTRTGRVVKAVNRLIENMVQKPLSKGLVDEFIRKSQSLLNLF